MATKMVILNCAQVRNPSVETVDCLARLQLVMRRRGRQLCLSNADDQLRGLIELAGLSGVLRVQVERQAEQREQLLSVEEEGELPDPAA